MAISVFKTFSAGEVLLAADLNASFTNFTTNATALVSPFTADVSMGGHALFFDGSQTISLTAGSAALNLVGAALNTPQAADVASATTIDLNAAAGNVVDVTGTTAITAVTLSQGRWRLVRFTGALTLTNGASLVLPGGVNITTVAGDYALLIGYASSVVRCALYSPIGVTGTGSAVRATSPTLVTPVLGVATATSINKTIIVAPANTSSLSIADGKTLTASNSLTFAGTDSTTITFPSTSTTFGFGTYTPTLTNTTNVSASASAVAQYYRIGDMVTVSGTVNIDPTSGVGASTLLGISLPIASNFSSGTEGGGTAAQGNGTGTGTAAAIGVDTVNKRMSLAFSCTDTTARDWLYHFTYRIV